MHELTSMACYEICDIKSNDIDKMDNRIRKWLEEKAKEIAQNIHERHLEVGRATNLQIEIRWIEKILGLTHKSLEEQTEDIFKNNTDNKFVLNTKFFSKEFARMAKQHFNNHPEDLCQK